MIIEKKKSLLEKEYSAQQEKQADLGIEVDWILN